MFSFHCQKKAAIYEFRAAPLMCLNLKPFLQFKIAEKKKAVDFFSPNKFIAFFIVFASIN